MRDRIPTTTHSRRQRDVVWKMACKAGTLMTLHCNAIQKRMLNKSFLLPRMPVFKRECSLRILKECISWDRDSTAKHIVELPVV